MMMEGIFCYVAINVTSTWYDTGGNSDTGNRRPNGSMLVFILYSHHDYCLSVGISKITFSSRISNWL